VPDPGCGFSFAASTSRKKKSPLKVQKRFGYFCAPKVTKKITRIFLDGSVTTRSPERRKAQKIVEILARFYQIGCSLVFSWFSREK
jgi:hypothetical protein